jgi:mannose-1-phosphate guanylyltransferase
MAQAILLVGGFGTRLMPLTQTVPKPMLPLAGLPVTEHQLAMVRRAGITSLVLATSYLAEVFIPYFGDGSKWGINLQYAVEEEPLGTGGAIRNAAQLLNRYESIVVLNGDILSSHDLAKQIHMHENLKADVTMHLTHVADARAYGCVPVDNEGRVLAFLEKMEKPVTDTINAGCYVFNPRVVNLIPERKVVSVEREIFPDLVNRGVPIYGMVDDSYWIDIGNPAALLRASIDVVTGIANSTALDGLPLVHRSTDYAAHEGSIIDPGAVITGGSAIGRGAKVGVGALVDGSVICDGADVRAGAQLHNSFVAAAAIVSADLHVSDSYVSRGVITSLLPL